MNAPLIRPMAVVLAGLLLTACSQASGSDEDPTCQAESGLVLVVAVHQNTQAPSVPAPLGCTLESTIAAGSPVVVIGVDGTPSPLLAETFKISDANGDARQADIAAATNRVVGTINNATADADGSDLLAAIAMGADEARGLGASDARMIIIDSGLPDRGALNMTVPGMLGAVPAEVAEFLKVNDSLPNLTGLTAELVGFGYTTAPQIPLTIAAQNNTLQIWTSTLETAGADVIVTPLARTGNGPDTTFATKTVEVPADPTPSSPDRGESRTEVYDDTTVLGFLPDSTELREPDAAQQLLLPLAHWLADEPGRSAHIVGTTASWGTEESRAWLSQARADAIKDLLASLGAGPEQISTEGAGYTATPPDRTPGGELDPALAVLNRTVRITTTG